MVEYANINGLNDCECHRCIEEKGLKGELTGNEFYDSLPLDVKKMILCPECGNKRCPHASDHRLKCTNSNETGQPGSIYPKINFKN